MQPPPLLPGYTGQQVCSPAFRQSWGPSGPIEAAQAADLMLLRRRKVEMQEATMARPRACDTRMGMPPLQGTA